MLSVTNQLYQSKLVMPVVKGSVLEKQNTWSNKQRNHKIVFVKLLDQSNITLKRLCCAVQEHHLEFAIAYLLYLITTFSYILSQCHHISLCPINNFLSISRQNISPQCLTTMSHHISLHLKALSRHSIVSQNLTTGSHKNV